MLLSTPESSLMCTEVVDIDQVEEDDNGCCGDYAKEIFSYLREAEVRFVCVCVCVCKGVFVDSYLLQRQLVYKSEHFF